MGIFNSLAGGFEERHDAKVGNPQNKQIYNKFKIIDLSYLEKQYNK